MTTPQSLTRSVELQITRDWQREIPSLGMYAARRLLRRVGPLLVGICLERDSGGSSYKPMFHVHFLGIEATSVLLTMFTQLRSDHSGGPDFVQVRFHGQVYKDAVARMLRQSPLPLVGDLSLDQVIAAYTTYLSSPLGRAYPVSLYHDLVLLSAWANRPTEATTFLTQCLQIGDKTDFQHLGGRAAFEAECRQRIETPALVQRMVESQILALGLSNLPVSNLLR